MFALYTRNGSSPSAHGHTHTHTHTHLHTHTHTHTHTPTHTHTHTHTHSSYMYPNVHLPNKQCSTYHLHTHTHTHTPTHTHTHTCTHTHTHTGGTILAYRDTLQRACSTSLSREISDGTYLLRDSLTNTDSLTLSVR